MAMSEMVSQNSLEHGSVSESREIASFIIVDMTVSLSALPKHHKMVFASGVQASLSSGLMSTK